MNIIEAIEKIKAQKFEPMELNGVTILVPVEGRIERPSCNAVIDIECDANGTPYVSYYRSLPPKIKEVTTWGTGGNMSNTSNWLVMESTNEIQCEDITATDWEFTPYLLDVEHEPDPSKDIMWCKRNCPGMYKDGCEVSKDYIPNNVSAIHVSCPYPKNKELIAEAKVQDIMGLISRRDAY